MSRSSSGFTLSWPLIIALIFGYNLLFDDEDENTVTVEDQPAVVQVETQEGPSIEDKLKEVGAKLKDVGQEVIVIVQEELETHTKEGETNDPAQDIKEEKEEAVAEQTTVVEEPAETIEDKPETEDETGIGMKKL